jgi:hypothetical protein
MRLALYLLASVLLSLGTSTAIRAQEPHPAHKPLTAKSHNAKATHLKPKKCDHSAQDGAKMHPKQERAYAQAYKTGTVSKP